MIVATAGFRPSAPSWARVRRAEKPPRALLKTLIDGDPVARGDFAHLAVDEIGIDAAVARVGVIDSGTTGRGA